MSRNIAGNGVRLAAVLGAALVAVSGCEESSPPPPASGSSGSSGGGGGPLSHMSDQPQSVLGKSAQSGKNVAKDMQQSQSRELGIAKETTGEATAMEVGGLTFSIPNEWQKATPPPGAMRAAEFTVGSAGETATIVFFTGIGGTAAMNADRWKKMVVDDASQPAEQDVTKTTVVGIPTTLVSSEGTYTEMTPSGQPGPARRGYAFRGAIIEAPQGNLIIRLSGPKAVVAGVEGAWREMIEGARKK